MSCWGLLSQPLCVKAKRPRYFRRQKVKSGKLQKESARNNPTYLTAQGPLQETHADKKSGNLQKESARNNPSYLTAQGPLQEIPRGQNEISVLNKKPIDR